MSRREVCFIIGSQGAVLACDLSGSPVSMADTRSRWEMIWALRAEVEEIVHSHPLGPDDFSTEDLTTMVALDAALGRKLRYSVVSPACVVVRENGHRVEPSEPEPWWVPLLRAASGMS